MASRSVQIHFNNNTNSVLTLSGSGLSHGIWTPDDEPPRSIAAGQQNVQWGSESDGLATGTQGYVKYELGAGGELMISWDNPYVGSNGYSVSAPDGYACPHTGGREDNANVTFTLKSE